MAANRKNSNCSVPGLYSLVDINALCLRSNLKLSQEANDAILYSLIHKIGPKVAHKAIDKLVAKGAIVEEQAEYEVEAVLDKHINNDETFYLVKWKNWPSQYNTWEPAKGLGNCDEAISAYESKSWLSDNQRDRKRQWDEESHTESVDMQVNEVFTKIRSAELKIDAATLVEMTDFLNSTKRSLNALKPKLKCQRADAWATNKRCKTYRAHKNDQQNALEAWGEKYNKVFPDCPPICVENEVDLECVPENFTLINDYQMMPGIPINENPVVGCKCENGCTAQSRCCPAHSGAAFAYTTAKRVRLPPGSPIYECNKMCACGPDCRNRVVQLGAQVKLTIFKTANGCGWGVKTRQKILKGTFVMEYIGEIISNEEAECRGERYDTEGFTYLFDLDFNEDECLYTIDARDYGNVSHFVNHSCDPNMSVYGVWINNLDVSLPRIALFANRDISRGEELTFDYKMTGDTTDEPPSDAIDKAELAEADGVASRPDVDSAQAPSTAVILNHSAPEASSSTLELLDIDFQQFKKLLPIMYLNQEQSIEPEANGEPLPECDFEDFKKIIFKGRALPLGDLTNIIDVNDESKPVVNNAQTTLSNTSSEEFKTPDTSLSSNVSSSDRDSYYTDGQLETPKSPPLKRYPLSPRSPAKNKFSCKDYRIACHCGAANCRKFLF